MKKRLLSMLMAVLMIASLVPAAALADGTTAALDPVINIKVDATAKQPGIKVTPTSKDYTDYNVVITPFTKLAERCDKHTPVTKELLVASCEQAGLTVTYCSVCGVDLNTKVVTPKLHHDCDFTVVAAPICATEDGWGYAVCKKCGNPYAVDASSAETLKQYIEQGKTESAAAYNARVNDVLAMFQKSKAHDYQTVTATIMEKDANGKDTKVVAAYAGVEATHVSTIEGNAVAYKWVDDGAYIKYSVVKANNDLITSGKVVSIDSRAYTAGVACTKCGNVQSKGGPQNGTGLNVAHKDYMTLIEKGVYPKEFKEDGSYKDGKTDTYYCSVCHKTFGGEVISAAKWFNVTETVEPKIGDVMIYDGNETVWQKNADDQLVTVANPNKAVAATCCEVGNTGDVIVYTASGAADEDGNIPAVWMLKEVGKKIDKLDHHYVVKPDDVASCTEKGTHYVGVYVCDNVVGKKDDGTPLYCYEENKTEGTKKDVINYTEEIAAAHTPTVEVLVEATCQHAGLSVLKCTVCNKYLKATTTNDVTTYTDVANNVIAAYKVDKVKHVAADELANVVEATCTEAGYTGDKVCKWCGEVLEKGKEVKALGHTPEDVAAVEATCTEAGATAGTKCSVCGEILSGCEKIDALGHDFQNGKCTRCDAVDPDYKPEVKNPFTDVKEGDAFYDDILWAADNGIVDGIKAADGTLTFQAGGQLTRAQVVQMLWNANGKPEAKAAADFSDVAADAWYAKAVAWAVEAGIINGYGDGTFGANDACTRAQFVKMLWVINGSPKADAADFSDVAADAWYAQAVAWAAAEKVTLGDGEGHFLPNDTCTRGQAVAFLHRAPALTVSAAE